jgi:hypothetical protein
LSLEKKLQEAYYLLVQVLEEKSIF